MTLENDSTERTRDSGADRPDPEDVNPDPDEAIIDTKCSTLRQKRRDGQTYMEIATSSQLDTWDIVAHIRGNCDCEADEDPVLANSDKPWAEKELVEELFIEQNYHFTEIAELFGCHHETVKNWARDHHEITIVDDSIRTSSKTVRQLQRIGIQNEDDIDLPPEARESPFDSE